MEHKTPSQRLVAALHLYIAEGGELHFEEVPPRGVYPHDQDVRVVTVTVDAKRYDDAWFWFRGY